MATSAKKEKKERKRRKLTANQIIVLGKIADQVRKGKVNVTEAMRGIYAPSVPSTRITALPEYESLLQKFLPDEKLAKRHEELLDKRDIEVVFDYERVEDEDGEPDEETGELPMKTIKKPRIIDKGPETNAVKAALDMAYKIKGRYPKEGANVALQFNFGSKNADYRQ